MGMTVLLDTHALLWAWTAPDLLSPTARAIIESPDNTLLVSAASAWEIATKHRLGRLPEAETVLRGYAHHLRALGATELPISSEHAILAGTLAAPHRDPFDRMLAAQALIEGVPLISKDDVLTGFGITLTW
jgi:PIN domain nuclease of toxin-antitoxin system